MNVCFDVEWQRVQHTQYSLCYIMLLYINIHTFLALSHTLSMNLRAFSVFHSMLSLFFLCLFHIRNFSPEKCQVLQHSEQEHVFDDVFFFRYYTDHISLRAYTMCCRMFSYFAVFVVAGVLMLVRAPLRKAMI